MSELRSCCDLCSATDGLMAIAVAPRDETVTLCSVCQAGQAADISDAPHWRCLADAIWSEDPAVKVVAYRLLQKLSAEAWARDLLDIAYLEPDTLAWADEGSFPAGEMVEHRDSNGVLLSAGDTVTLTKDLTVKGAGFTAKRGTAVRGISLVPDNAGQIEGRVNGQQIVILCEFVKKSG